MNVLIVGIAEVAHAINAAYCKALGDETQTDWADAPEWQQQSAINGVQMHLANPESTPEQSHESWLKQKLDEGWVYGETKDAEAKQHPCCVPYAELPIEQKAKDYIFRAAVHAAKALVDSMPKPTQIKQPVAQSQTGFSAKTINIQYIGVRDEWLDHTYGTGLHFTKGQVRALPVIVANKLLRHPDIFQQAEDLESQDDEETLILIDEAQDKAAEEEASKQRHYDILHEVSKMSRDGLVQFAAERYQVKLNGRGKADDLREEVNQLINQYGFV